MNARPRIASCAAGRRHIWTRRPEIEKLKFQITKLRRMQFDRSSERIARQIEQLELHVEELETGAAQEEAESAIQDCPIPAIERAKPKRRALPEHLPRQQIVHEPENDGACTCPERGANMAKLGEDITEVLDCVPGYFRVIRDAGLAANNSRTFSRRSPLRKTTLPGRIRPVPLKDVLRQVQTDRANLSDGRLLLSGDKHHHSGTPRPLGRRPPHRSLDLNRAFPDRCRPLTPLPFPQIRDTRGGQLPALLALPVAEIVLWCATIDILLEHLLLARGAENGCRC